MDKSIFELDDLQRSLCLSIAAQPTGPQGRLDTCLDETDKSLFYDLAAANDVTAHIGHRLAERNESGEAIDGPSVIIEAAV